MKFAQIAIAALLLGACASAQPKPQPAATESSIQLCVVDTIAPGGMMAISAIVAPAAKDTFVLQSEGRVPVRALVAGPRVLADAKWVSGGKSFQLVNSSRLRFAAAETPRAFAPGSIALLGMYRGTPVFARGREMGKMRAEIEALSARGLDLEKALQQRSNLRRDAERLTYLYVPTALSGCVFQPFRKAPPPRRR